MLHTFRMGICLLLLACGITASAQTDTASRANVPATGSHLRISLATCGPGSNEVYEVFGHTAVRIIDSVAHTDIAYNYGEFDGFDKDFEWKFMRGKLGYCLGTSTFSSFVNSYVEYKRSVSEQEIHLTDQQKTEIRDFLEWNALPANRGYKYDFFFDNCATRIRDIFPKYIQGFKYPNVLPPGKLTFRDIINKYFIPKPWERIGVNILLGSKIDKVMTNEDIMFLPDYLCKGMEGATTSGVKTAGPDTIIVPSAQPPLGKGSGPLLLTSFIAVITITTLSISKLRAVGKIVSATLLFVTGLLGCLILVMWFGTDHQACRENYNLLWALPTNVIVAFTKPKGKPRYALVAIGMLLGSLMMHFLGVQAMLFPEMLPLLVALGYVYFTINKDSLSKPVSPNASNKN